MQMNKLLFILSSTILFADIKDQLIGGAADMLYETYNQTTENLMNGDAPWEKKDTGWDEFEKEESGNSLKDGIDQFFNKYNTPSNDTPYEINFGAPSDSISQSYLETEPSHVQLNSFSNKNRPLDIVKGGDTAAKGSRMHDSPQIIDPRHNLPLSDRP